MNKFARFSLVPAGLVALAGSVHAAVPEAVTEAVTDMKADGLTVAGLVLAAVIAIYAVKFIRKGL